MASRARYLLDTSTFLWASADRSRLSARALAVIDDQEPELFLSFASVWEMQIKHALGKLPLPESAERFASRAAQELKTDILVPSLSHIGALYSLPHIHRDPFDRMILAQAHAEGMPLITPDPVMRQYLVDVIW